jgi:hypothetical protein
VRHGFVARFRRSSMSRRARSCARCSAIFAFCLTTDKKALQQKKGSVRLSLPTSSGSSKALWLRYSSSPAGLNYRMPVAQSGLLRKRILQPIDGRSKRPLRSSDPIGAPNRERRNRQAILYPGFFARVKSPVQSQPEALASNQEKKTRVEHRKFPVLALADPSSRAPSAPGTSFQALVPSRARGTNPSCGFPCIRSSKLVH